MTNTDTLNEYQAAALALDLAERLAQGYTADGLQRDCFDCGEYYDNDETMSNHQCGNCERLELEAPRAWIGCLGCYNGGTLNGAWRSDLLELSPFDFTTCAKCGGDEYQAFDLENFRGLLTGEPSIPELIECAQFIEDNDEDTDLEALGAWLTYNGYPFSQYQEFYTAEYEESYNGRWTDFQAFADEAAGECFTELANPTGLARYFDAAAWARDLAHDYTVLDIPGTNEVAVFRD